MKKFIGIFLIFIIVEINSAGKNDAGPSKKDKGKRKLNEYLEQNSSSSSNELIELLLNPTEEWSRESTFMPMGNDHSTKVIAPINQNIHHSSSVLQNNAINEQPMKQNQIQNSQQIIIDESYSNQPTLEGSTHQIGNNSINERARQLEKKFFCKKCDQGFKQFHHLIRHLQNKRQCIEKGSTQFVCQNCEKTFNRKENLRNHRRKTKCIKKLNIQNSSSAMQNSPININNVINSLMEQNPNSNEISQELNSYPAANHHWDFDEITKEDYEWFANWRASNAENVPHSSTVQHNSPSNNDIIINQSMEQNKLRNNRPIRIQSPSNPIIAIDQMEINPTNVVGTVQNKKLDRICDICGREFKFPCQMIVHRRTHSNEEPYKCNICKKGFIDNKTRRRHEQNQPNVIRFKCDVCGKRFKDIDSCKRHEKAHQNKRPNICPICGSRFEQKGNLTVHLKKLHSSSSQQNSPNNNVMNNQLLEEQIQWQNIQP